MLEFEITVFHAPFSDRSGDRTMIEYKGYLSKIGFDSESDIFHGEVINIRDVITFQGKSTEELRRALEDSVEDYLEFC